LKILQQRRSIVNDDRAVPVTRDWRIETERLILTACDEEADETLARIVAQPRVYESYFMEPAPDHWGQTHAETWCGRGPTLLGVAARERNSGRVIGAVQFEGNWLAYLVDPELWGRGFGGEMVTACVAQVPALLSLHELQTSLLRENRASQRIVERAGFQFAGLAQVRWGACAARAVLHYRWLSRNPCLATPVAGCAG
jgi:RimJ/RimL family protein N-acetyltransferase